MMSTARSPGRRGTDGDRQAFTLCTINMHTQLGMAAPSAACVDKRSASCATYLAAAAGVREALGVLRTCVMKVAQLRRSSVLGRCARKRPQRL